MAVLNPCVLLKNADKEKGGKIDNQIVHIWLNYVNKEKRGKVEKLSLSTFGSKMLTKKMEGKLCTLFEQCLQQNVKNHNFFEAFWIKS